MGKLNGVFENWGVAYGRFCEVFIDGHWWVVGDSLENIGKTTKRLLQKAYPFIYGGAGASLMRGSSPKASGYAKPTKEISQRFKD